VLEHTAFKERTGTFSLGKMIVVTSSAALCKNENCAKSSAIKIISCRC